MIGKATLQVPASGFMGSMAVSDLSDELAMSYGTLFSRTLSDDDGYVQVTLESGKDVIIGHDGKPFERPSIDMEVIRRCGGFREWANQVVMGPAL